jgi:histidinol-phosphate aminotransferase
MIPEEFVRKSIRAGKSPAYPEPRPGFLRMDANTSLFGENPALSRVDDTTLAGYPSGISTRLVEALAREHDVDPAQVIVGNGSDGLIDHLAKAFLNPGDPLVLATPTFVMYPFYGRVNLGRVREIPLLLPGFQLDVNGMIETGGHLTFVASPNNPTGNAFPAQDLERLIRESRGVVVIDEAYADFCGQDFTKRVSEFDNLVVLRTFSKAHGLAGIRVGYAIGPAPLIENLYRVKAAFEVGAFHEEVALEALADRSWLERAVETIRSERPRVSGELEKLGCTVSPSDANFLFVDVGYAPVVKSFLADRKILVRDFPDRNGWIRVTLGPPEINDRFLGAMGAWRRESE